MNRVWTKEDQASLKYPVRRRSDIRREELDKKLTEEFSVHPRFQGLSWYTDPSTESRHRCLRYVCTCGKYFTLLPHSVRKGYNPELLCPECVQPRRRRGVGSVNPNLKPTSLS